MKKIFLFLFLFVSGFCSAQIDTSTFEIQGTNTVRSAANKFLEYTKAVKNLDTGEGFTYGFHDSTLTDSEMTASIKQSLIDYYSKQPIIDTVKDEQKVKITKNEEKTKFKLK